MRRGVGVAVVVIGVVATVPAVAPAASWGPSVAVSAATVDIDHATGVTTTGGDHVIVADRYGTSGTSAGVIGVPGDLAGPPGFEQLGSGLTRASRPVADGRGVVWVGWVTPAADGGGSTAYVSRRLPTGGLVSERLPTGPGPGLPVVAAAGAGGDVAAAWVERRGDDAVLLVATRHGDDAAFSAGAEVLRAPNASAGGFPAVAVLSGDEVVVSWAVSPTRLLVRTLDAAGRPTADARTLVDGPQVADVAVTGSGTRALVTWTDGSGMEAGGPRTLRGAVTSAAGTGTPVALSAVGEGPFEPAVTAAAGAGAVVAWAGYRHDELGAHGSGMYSADVSLVTGEAGPPTPVVNTRNTFVPGSSAYGTPQAVWLSADGRALLASDGPRVAERPAGGRAFTDPELAGCRSGTALSVAEVGGVPTVVWDDHQTLAAVRRVYVSRRTAATPLVCPYRGPTSPRFVPEQPHVGEEVLIDASGQASDEAGTEWSWDLDGDGTFELDWADRPTVRTVFPTVGYRQVGVRIRYVTARGTNGWGGFTLQTTVQPPSEDAPTGAVARPNLTQPTGPTGSPGPVRSPAAPASFRTLSAPGRVSAAALRRRGLAVRVRSSRAGRASATLAGSGWRTARASRRVRAGRSATLRLRPVRVRACRTGSVAMRLRLTWPDRTVTRSTVRVVCRGR